MIRVAIIDDEPMARKIIRNYLQDESDIDIIGECKNGMEALGKPSGSGLEISI